MRLPSPSQALAEARSAAGAGDHARALAAAQQALAGNPDSTEALVLAVNSALRCDQLLLAVPWLEALLRSHPDHVQFQRLLSTAHNNLGSRQLQAGETSVALLAFSRALTVWPDNAESLFNRARLALDAGQPGAALADLERLSAQHPHDQAAAILRAEARIATDDAEPPLQARDALAGLCALQGFDPLRLAQAQADAGEGEAALQAVLRSAERTQAERAAGIAFRLAENADAPRARAAFQHLADHSGRGRDAPGLRWCIGQRLALPAVYRNHADLDAARDGYARGMAELLDEFDVPTLARCAPHLEQLQWSNLLLAYQGQDDRALQIDYGRFLGRALDAFAPALRAPPGPRRPGPPRIGFLSSAFRYGTVGGYFGSWIEAATHAGFDTSVFQLGPAFDDATAAIERTATRLLRIDAPLARIAQTLRDADLDLLVLPDLGVDPRIVVLGSLALARRQTMAWGQPSTAGLDRVDAFISCSTMEPVQAAAHYSERLLLLPGIGTRFVRPAAPQRRAPAELGLPAGRLYLVPQAPFKIHPDADAPLAAIAAADPDAVLLLFAGARPRSIAALRTRLAGALRAAGADPRRQLQFLAPVRRSRFLEICAACDVMVDTPHWSGGNTTLDALLAGLPVVTQPGALMRGRQSMAMLRMLGLDELVCADADALARTALAVAGDAQHRAHLAQRIAQDLPQLLDGTPALQQLLAHFRTLLGEAGAPLP